MKWDFTIVINFLYEHNRWLSNKKKKICFKKLKDVLLNLDKKIISSHSCWHMVSLKNNVDIVLV